MFPLTPDPLRCGLFVECLAGIFIGPYLGFAHSSVRLYKIMASTIFVLTGKSATPIFSVAPF